MDHIQYNTPCVIKLGSFAGKIKYCLVDTFVIPLLKIFRLKIECINNRLVVIANDGLNDVLLHELIWEYFYQDDLSNHHSFIYHRNGITMDNRLENLTLIPTDQCYSSIPSLSSEFYWQIISHLPVDMDEVDYHHTSIEQSSSLYECHNAACTQLLHHEQFICRQCKKIKYCSQFCQSMDVDIHSIFCHPLD